MKKVAPGKKTILWYPIVHVAYVLWTLHICLWIEKTSKPNREVRDPVCTYGLFSKADQVGDGGRRDLLLGLSPWQLAEVSLDTDERATNVTVRYVYCKQRLCEHPVVLGFFQDNFVFFIDNVLDSKHYTSREIGIKLWNWFLSEAIIKFFPMLKSYFLGFYQSFQLDWL